jgi:hypothetical protein
MTLAKNHPIKKDLCIPPGAQREEKINKVMDKLR